MELSLDENGQAELEVTVKLRYKVDPAHYELSGPADRAMEEMAETDQRNFEDDPGCLFEFLESDSYDVEVKPLPYEDKLDDFEMDRD